MGVRRPAKFKNEIVPHPHLISDRTQDHHQESSSSSSADNGGPQTPSPLCQESVVAHIVDENAHHDDPRVPPPVLAEKAIDPHFARLLNSLSISAQMADGKDLAPTALVTTVIPVPSSTTPVPASASSTTSLPASATSTDRADWSTQVPPRISDRSKISTPPSVKLGQPTGSSPKSTSENFPPASSVRPSQPTPAPSTRNQRSTPLDSLPIPPSTSPSAAEAASTARPSVSRKGSSATADISPYLSKPTELPVSGKRLKQLALLESVADESARMTPVLGQRFLPLNASFGNMSMDPRSGGYPGPCMSVPPPPMTSFNGGLGDSRVIYSSNPNIGYLPGPSARMPAPMHVPPPVPPSSVYDDPFQVRPRTSAAFHPSHLGHGNPRMSMNERQLLTLLSGPPFYAPAPSAPSNPTGFARSMHPSAIPPPPQFPSMDHPPQMPMSHVGPMPPLRIEPSRMLPSSMSSAPLSAPIRPGGFDMFAQTVPRSATNNVQLLSILNSAGAPPAGSPAPVPPPGILHR
ncbi:hypothetical protein JAAARDRAFT_29551 [Jaapia argillacea MUCL 33604]|uniref:Uncharacterized protein n=1 Tax=Jaapia argillacea MUCL 33604 TaxID=933084 RepID=A0A067QBK1_9AGAM|nr:hypothetical protein JAAARDRAFT_29551 [Jaapia argillacea MUCL 33604]